MSAPAKQLKKFDWRDLLRHNDVLLAVGMVMVVAMMLIPLPNFILDVLLTIDIALGVTILLVTVYSNEPLQYSTFPTVLLMATLFRLGLNVSSTRLILMNGNEQGGAGSVIQAFGHFVVQDNYVVGILLFIILVVINFIVITNGSGRVSEVAARFTLDAMPGKQLSIDADLNAGLIDDKEAKRRRKLIQREADFYGTMDGASKFVKGDAIAAIIIVVVNIVGGLIIGVVQMQMPVEEAAKTFTILTIGEGLVAQIPALLISAATGILVTRISSEDSTLGDDIGAQMFMNPKILFIVGGLMLLLSGFLQSGSFVAIGLMAIGGGFLVIRETKAREDTKVQDEVREKAIQKKKATTENVMDLLQVEPLELEIGYRLVSLIEQESGGDLLDRIAQIRRQVALDLGFVLPSVRVRDNLQLSPNQYNIKLRGITIDSGEVISDLWLAMSTDPDATEPIPGIQTKEPAFGLPALWIQEDQKETAEASGYTVVSASAVVSTHLTEVIRRHASDILSRQDVQGLLDNVKKQNDSLVNDLIPDHLTTAEVHVILQNMLREKVSVRDMASILEALSYHYRVSKDPDFLTEQCRMALSRSICKQFQSPDTGELPAITLGPEVEEQLANGLTDTGQFILSPAFTQGLLAATSKEIERVISSMGVQPVLLCNGRLRLPYRRLIERSLPQIAVLSYNEIGSTVRVHSVGVVRIGVGQTV